MEAKDIFGYGEADQLFFKQENKIKIEPFFSGKYEKLISFSMYSFKAGTPVLVPMWLAIYLKKRNKCAIIIPSRFEKA